jgi:hypothetical protein
MKSEGELGDWQMFENGFEPWRSMYVCFLMLSSSFLQCISVSVLYRLVNRQLA